LWDNTLLHQQINELRKRYQIVLQCFLSIAQKM